MIRIPFIIPMAVMLVIIACGRFGDEPTYNRWNARYAYQRTTCIVPDSAHATLAAAQDAEVRKVDSLIATIMKYTIAIDEDAIEEINDMRTDMIRDRYRIIDIYLCVSTMIFKDNETNQEITYIDAPQQLKKILDSVYIISIK